MDAKLQRAIERHQVGYQIAAHVFGIPLRPAFYDRGLRRFADEIIDPSADDGSPQFLEKCALIMLAGAAAVGECKEYSHRDELEARDQLFYCYYRHHGGESERNDRRQLSLFVESRMRILQRQAEQLIAEHLDEPGKGPAREPKAEAPLRPQAELALAELAALAEARAVEVAAPEYQRLVLIPVVDG